MAPFDFREIAPSNVELLSKFNLFEIKVFLPSLMKFPDAFSPLLIKFDCQSVFGNYDYAGLASFFIQIKVIDKFSKTNLVSQMEILQKPSFAVKNG